MFTNKSMADHNDFTVKLKAEMTGVGYRKKKSAERSPVPGRTNLVKD
jgi:hypothetical protein